MIFLRSFLCLTLTTVALGHGMDALGPHGGYIRMPGAFHTELVSKSSGFSVYLLDVDIKNPTTQNSSVSGHLKSGSKESPIKCQAVGQAFDCSRPVSKLKDGDKLVLRVKKGSMVGIAVYKFPLALIKH